MPVSDSISAFKDLVEIRDSRAAYLTQSTSSALGRFELSGKCHFAVACIAKCIARDLRGRGGHANLVLIVETQLGRHLARALPGLNDIAFSAQGEMARSERT